MADYQTASPQWEWSCVVYDDAGNPQGEDMWLTKAQIADLEAQLPDGWYIDRNDEQPA